MKVLTDTLSLELETPVDEFTLPQGIVGFAHYTRAQLLRENGGHPFMRMKLRSPAECVHFVVMEPNGFIPGYEPELFDSDAAALGLADASDAMILTILTMKPGTPEEATVNLIGPIVVNRRTRIGRQVVISNYADYRARHPLIASRETAAGPF
jgi:flagellar assembly factor FliW